MKIEDRMPCNCVKRLQQMSRDNKKYQKEFDKKYKDHAFAGWPAIDHTNAIRALREWYKFSTRPDKE